MLGGEGNDIFISEGGNDLLEGGPGRDIYRYPADIPVGTDRIMNFSAVDRIELSATFGFTAAQAKAALIQTGADTVLSLSPGNSITFLGIAPSAISLVDFIIV